MPVDQVRSKPQICPVYRRPNANCFERLLFPTPLDTFIFRVLLPISDSWNTCRYEFTVTYDYYIAPNHHSLGTKAWNLLMFPLWMLLVTVTLFISTIIVCAIGTVATFSSLIWSLVDITFTGWAAITNRIRF